MRKTSAFLVLLLVLCGASCSTAAPRSRADQRDFFFVILRRPPTAPHLDDAAAERLQTAHMANIKRMYEEGHLVAAGPFMDDTTLRGIFVFATSRADDARQWLASDPAVRAGRLGGDLHPFTATADTFHKVGADVKFEMENYEMVLLTRVGGPEPSRRAVEQHAAFVEQLQRAGKLALAAEFHDADQLRTLLILTTKDNEAATIVARDPFVAESGMHAEVHPWITQQGVLQR